MLCSTCTAAVVVIWTMHCTCLSGSRDLTWCHGIL
uniref:Uncharacterized protein n=1 Tax=Arundo donax TaxID=35708 RepID=A0A0A9BGH3_ARUDO